VMARPILPLLEQAQSDKSQGVWGTGPICVNLFGY
jgi:hypothetical protein